VLGSLASGLLLYGMSLLYGATGTLDLAALHAAVAGSQERTLLLMGTVFLVAGIAFKFGAAPFHMWLPDTYHGAPTAITVFIGSAPKLAAFAMAFRLLEAGVGPLSPEWRLLVAALSVASLAVGNLIALAQSNLKRMLAYSTISHVGFVFMGIAAANAAGYAAAMFYAISYAIMATASFGAIVVLARNGYESDGIDDFRGLAARSPWLAGMMLCAMMSLAGIPPFLGFWAKLAVLRAAIVGIVFAVIGCFYYLRVCKAMYFDAPPESVPSPRPNDRILRTAFGVNALALLGLGLAWNPIMAWCQAAFQG
jgi:NADH-quinone oxidoreductase subunit N